MFVTDGKYRLPALLLCAALAACSSQKPAEPEKPQQQPTAVVKSRHPVLTQDQRRLLGFPLDVIEKVEKSAGSEAEPFFVTTVVPSENLKGEKGFEKEKLAGFSVRTKKAEDLITSFQSGLRVRGFLIFRSRKSYGELPDIVTVVKGNNSYDILNIQGTEALNYRLTTKAIVAWLKSRQTQGSFVVTGAGPDWLEARFVKQPKDMVSFARNVIAFAPDVRAHGPGTAEKLAERMKRTNGFFLEWD